MIILHRLCNYKFVLHKYTIHYIPSICLVIFIGKVNELIARIFTFS